MECLHYSLGYPGARDKKNNYGKLCGYKPDLQVSYLTTASLVYCMSCLIQFPRSWSAVIPYVDTGTKTAFSDSRTQFWKGFSTSIAPLTKRTCSTGLPNFWLLLVLKIIMQQQHTLNKSCENSQQRELAIFSCHKQMDATNPYKLTYHKQFVRHHRNCRMKTSWVGCAWLLNGLKFVCQWAKILFFAEIRQNKFH